MTEWQRGQWTCLTNWLTVMVDWVTDRSIPVRLSLQKNGTYCLNFTPVQSGCHFLHVAVDSQPVKVRYVTVSVDSQTVKVRFVTVRVECQFKVKYITIGVDHSR